MKITHYIWRPGDHEYLWFASDKNNRIAMFNNYMTGEIPLSIMTDKDFKEAIDSLYEYIFEESNRFSYYRKHGQTVLKYYSFDSFRHRSHSRFDKTPETPYTLEEVLESITKYNQDNFKNICDENFPSRKGLFLFDAIRGYRPNCDYPVGYEGETQAGDYFSFLMPTDYATLDDIPEVFHSVIAKSDELDFTQTDLIKKQDIHKYFKKSAG